MRDISSLGAMDWGLARLENSSTAAAVAVAAVAVAVAAVVALWMEDSFDSNHIKEDLFDSNHTNEGGLIR